MLVGLLFLGGNQLKALASTRIRVLNHLGVGGCQLIQFVEAIPDRLKLSFHVLLGCKWVRHEMAQVRVFAIPKICRGHSLQLFSGGLLRSRRSLTSSCWRLGA